MATNKRQEVTVTGLDITDVQSNLISGQTGVDGNSGNKSAKTLRVVIATDQPQTTLAFKTDGSATTQPVSNTPLTNMGAGEYETVAASQTDQAMGATGATGDFLAGVLLVPSSLNPGAVSIKDGAGSAITIFAGGTASILTLHPFFVPLGMISAAGAWKITTGSAITAIGVGNFT